MQENNSNNIVSDDKQIPTRSIKQRLRAVAIIVVLLLFGIVCFKFLLATKPEAKKRPPVKMQALVKVMKTVPSVEPVIVKAFGTIKPAREIGLQARVSGTIEDINPSLVPGGIVRKGGVLVQLDKTDYLLALRQKKDSLAQAKADLRIEEGSQNVAKQEWELISSLTKNVDSSTQDLALRKPQLAKAEVKIQTAQTDVERAELDLSRTAVKAPFDAIVRQKHVDIGSQISTQSTIATLIGIDHFWVEITVPTSQLHWIVLPGTPQKPSAVSVFSGGSRFTGRLLKLLPDLEQDGLMARLLVEVEDPMSTNSEGPSLLINSFVRVEITGRQIKDVFKVPRAALRDKQEVYIVGNDDTLHVQPVKVVWEDADFAYIEEGIEAGMSLITSQIPAPIEGMPLKISGKRQKQAQGPGKE